jgi:hypothetical protein
MSGSRLEETVLLTQIWPKVDMDTDLIFGQAGILNLQEMLIFRKKCFSLFFLIFRNIKYMLSLKYMICTP